MSMQDRGAAVLHADAHSPSYATVSQAACPDAHVVDFCIPCNPYFPSPQMFSQLSSDLERILRYYPSDAGQITRRLARLLGLNPQTVAMANGSTELITWIDHLLVSSSLAVPIPTFGRWTDQPLETGKRVDMHVLPEVDGFALDLDAYASFVRERGSRVAVVCNPNNPDGSAVPRERLVRFLDQMAKLDLVVVDESFIDFVDDPQVASVAAEAAVRSNVVVLKSLGKNFGLHGVRFGYLVANPALAGTVTRALPKWNVNGLAEAVVDRVEDHWDDYLDSLARLARVRDAMLAALRTVPGLTLFPSTANFVLVKVPPGWSGTQLRDHLFARHAVFVRECGNKLGMTSEFLRLVIRPRQDVERLVAGLHDYARRRELAVA
jgi:histidinol-phosphate/aromatic aminotransferase/cobyric acid decarboxylase-like protein